MQQNTQHVVLRSLDKNPQWVFLFQSDRRRANLFFRGFPCKNKKGKKKSALNQMHVVHKAVGICLVQLAVLWGVCLRLMHYMLFAQYKWGRCREWQIHKRARDNGRLTTSAHHDCRTPFFLLPNCQALVASRRLLSLSLPLALCLHGWRNKNNVAAMVNDSWKGFKVNILDDDGFYEAATVPGHNTKTSR